MFTGRVVLRESLALEIFRLDRTRPWSLKRPKPVLLKSGAVILLFALFPAFIILTFTITHTVSSRFLPNFTSPVLYLLACKHEVQQSVSPLISFSITCVKKLSSVPSRNLLDCLCSAAWPFQQISWWLKSTVMSRACEHEASASCLNKVSFTFFFFILWMQCILWKLI